MKQIPLSQGKFSLIDDEDFEKISKYKWSFSHGYTSTRINKKTVYMHRMILDAPKGLEVDHIDHDGLNNQKSNIRLATIAQNRRHRGKGIDNTNGYKGITRDKSCSLGESWWAQIKVNNKKICTGPFICDIIAAEEYDKLALQYHGEFAELNFPIGG